MRAMIDRQILETAYARFGDFRKKILLSLPPQQTAKGPVEIGTILYDQDKWPLGLSKGELLQHLVVLGRSGSGKTNIVFHLLQQLAGQQVRFIFLDWKRTARHLLPSFPGTALYTAGRSIRPFDLNPFVPPPGLEWRVYVNQVVDILADAYDLGEGAKAILEQALLSAHRSLGRPPSVQEATEELARIPDRERVRGWKISTERALLSLSGLWNSQDPTAQERAIRTLMERNSVIELNGLSQSAKALLVPLLCLWIYQLLLSQDSREQLKIVVIIEEAHHVLLNRSRSKESVVEMLLRQCREIGMGMIIVDQHPHLLSAAALGNTYTSICLNLKDPRDIDRAARLSLVHDDEKHFISMLPIGQGIVKLQDRWQHPVLVRFPHVEIRKGSVTDAMLSAIPADSAHSERNEPSFPKPEQIRPSPGLAKALTEEELVLLQDVMANLLDGVKARYHRLGWSAERGNRVRDQLVRLGYLEREVVPLGTTRKVILRISPKARQVLGINGGVPREGLVHEYWKHEAARQLQDLGYQVQLEAPRVGGRVDVLARRGAEVIGVEVETGKSDFTENVRNCLRSGFSRVLVVAADSQTLTRLELGLVKASLLITGRVSLGTWQQLLRTLASRNA